MTSSPAADRGLKRAALQALGLEVVSDYNGQPARWLQTALDGADVRVINVKGIKTDDTICMVRPSKLEALVAAAGDGHLMELESAHEKAGYRQVG